jgi:hypothetical protein
MNFIKIKTETGYIRIPYQEQDDGWYVNSKQADDNDEWRQFTNSGGEIDLRQLLKKEYDIRY